jgi:hypothetical protein
MSGGRDVYSVLHQPSQRFLAGLENGKFVLGELLQVIKERRRKLVRSDPRGFLDIGLVKDGGFFQRPKGFLVKSSYVSWSGCKQHPDDDCERRDATGEFRNNFGSSLGVVSQPVSRRAAVWREIERPDDAGRCLTAASSCGFGRNFVASTAGHASRSDGRTSLRVKHGAFRPTTKDENGPVLGMVLVLRERLLQS